MFHVKQQREDRGFLETMDATGAWRRGHFMYLASGRYYWPLDPQPQDLIIDDIAHHLGNICRFNGATKRFYSVAEHSVYVSMICDPEDALEGLMHDAPEFALNDLIRPLKYDRSYAGGAAYLKVEDLNARVIAKRFGLRYPFPLSVKAADEAMARLETDPVRGLIRNPVEGSLIEPGTLPANVTLEGWMPDLAAKMFLGRYAEILNARRAIAA